MQPAFRKQLATWYLRYARDLPWRKRPTGYRVWVSEIMLQQTRVETVEDYFRRFVKRFPSLRRLAEADLEDVLQAWSGLGYYRRARMLHAAAKQVVIEHDGRIPRTSTQLIKLPGIGRYTVGAILSIAFDQPEPIVDGNIERVFARLTCLGRPLKTSEANKALWRLATEHVELGASEQLLPGVLNQALMELGATVCTPLSPRCSACPVATHCESLTADEVDRYPVMPKRSKPKTRRYLFVAAHDKRGRVLMQRRDEDDKRSLLPGGLWELPHTEWKGSKRRTLDHLGEEIGAELSQTGSSRNLKHSIMNYRLTLVVQPCDGVKLTPQTLRYKWFAPELAEKAAIASATRKLLKAIW